METMVRTAALPASIAGGCRCAAPVRCARRASSSVAFEVRGKPTVLLRTERRVARPSLRRCETRAEQSSGVNEVAKGDASAAQLLQEAAEEESGAAAESDAVDVLSVEQTEHPQPAAKFFEDVEVEAQEAASNVGGSVEGAAATLDERADEAAGARRQVGETTAETTALARRKVADAATDGYEVLKWIAEGLVSASKNAQETLGVARGLLDKRLKSFGIAADHTRSVSSEVADVAKTKFTTFRGSATKFGQEFQVNLDEKKAADSLKPESEASPLTKIGKELQDNLNKATAEDGPLGKVGGTLSESFSKVSQAGQELAAKGKELSTAASKKGEELSTAASKKVEELSTAVSSAGEDVKSQAKESAESSTKKVEDVKSQAKESAESSTKKVEDVKSQAKESAEPSTKKVDEADDDFVFNFEESQRRNGNVTGDGKSD